MQSPSVVRPNLVNDTYQGLNFVGYMTCRNCTGSLAYHCPRQVSTWTEVRFQWRLCLGSIVNKVSKENALTTIKHHQYFHHHLHNKYKLASSIDRERQSNMA